MKEKDQALADEFKLSGVKLEDPVRANCCTMFRELCKRNVQSIKRNPMVFKARMGQLVFMALIATAVFWQASGPTLKDMQNLVGSMFFMTMATFMPSYMMTTVTFQTERPVFLRE